MHKDILQNSFIIICEVATNCKSEFTGNDFHEIKKCEIPMCALVAYGLHAELLIKKKKKNQSKT